MNADIEIEYAPGHKVKKSALSASFDWVADKNDWRAPIDAVIDPSDDRLQFLLIAVRFFTGTELKFHGVGEPGKVRVTADGYRNGPCGP